MNNSIQYFLENGIPGLEKVKKDFFTNPMCFDEYIENVKNVVLDFGCHIISEVLEECNTLLEESLKRRLHWHIKDRSQKNIMSPVGLLSFTRTRFKNKETKETAYLLDRFFTLSPHTRMGDSVKAALPEEAVQTKSWHGSLPWGMCVQGNSDAPCTCDENTIKKHKKACRKKECQESVC